MEKVKIELEKVKIFLASSAELEEDRRLFEIEIYRKCKSWIDKGIFLHLNIWEDMSAKFSSTRSQDEYNKIIESSDILILLAFSKVGMYTAEEFEKAHGAFSKTNKPFIFTYFKKGVMATKENRDQLNSLFDFQNKLEKLGHFISHYTDFNDLWVQFNKELDRLEFNSFNEMIRSNENGSNIEVVDLSGTEIDVTADQENSSAKFEKLTATGGKIKIDIKQNKP